MKSEGVLDFKLKFVLFIFHFAYFYYTNTEFFSII